MSVLIPIALYAWPAAAVVIFLASPSRRWAVIVSMLAAWLLLPVAEIDMPLVPAYTKVTAAVLGVLIGVALTDFGRLISVRPGWIDLPMAVWCLAPAASALANGPLASKWDPIDPHAPDILSYHDALSGFLEHLIFYALPYFVGRLYFPTLRAHRDLAFGVTLAACAYAPLVLYEAKMSPQLHKMVYGSFQHDWLQTFRFGGWRPMVFLDHGLMLAAFIMGGTVCALWLWRSRSVRGFMGVPMWAMACGLVVVSVICRSLGAWALLALGMGAMAGARWARAPMLIAALALIPVLYVGARVGLGWDGREAVEIARLVSEDRAASLQFRLENETALVDRALERPLFGWSGYGRNRVLTAEGYDTTVTDGLWVITLGKFGVVGLTSLLAWLLIPPVLAVWRTQRNAVAPAEAAGTLALASVVLLFAIDSLPNAMINPIFIMMGGALAAFVAAPAGEPAPIHRPWPLGIGVARPATSATGRSEDSA